MSPDAVLALFLQLGLRSQSCCGSTPPDLLTGLRGRATFTCKVMGGIPQTEIYHYTIAFVDYQVGFCDFFNHLLLHTYHEILCGRPNRLDYRSSPLVPYRLLT